MISYDDALQRIVDCARPLGTETVAFSCAADRVLAEPLTARLAMPRTDVSAMDGYAVREADITEPPFSLPISGEAAAGAQPGDQLRPGTAIRIFTGAPVPTGADRVIVQENTNREGDRVQFLNKHGAGRNIRSAGSDFEEGEVLIEAGRRLDWRSLATAAAADRAAISVFRQPRVILLATGDELKAPGEALEQPGAIPESVSPSIAAFVRLNAGIVLRSERLPDDISLMAASAREALKQADLVIMLGGASVGDHDHSRSAFDGPLDYVFPKVAIKPGKPVWMARKDDRFILGLPGNPTSALVTARLFLAPLLKGLGGENARNAARFQSGVCADPIPACGDRETFMRAMSTEQGFRLSVSQDSSSQKSLSSADTLIRRLPGSPSQPANSTVDYLTF